MKLLLHSLHSVYDLSDPAVNRRIQIIDIMKTMDNRIAIDEDTIKHFNADQRIIEITQRYKEQREKDTRHDS